MIFKSTLLLRSICLLLILMQSARAAGQCSSVETLYCGLPIVANLNGQMQNTWYADNNCNTYPQGQVKVYSFTAPATGTYTLKVTSATGGTVHYYYKPEGLGCNSSAWSCISAFNAPGTHPIGGGMNAGQQFYFMVSGEGTGAYSHTFQIDCPDVDPCPYPTYLACGTPMTVTLAGEGAWNNNACGFSTPGQEKIFRFTANVTGPYNIFFLGGSGITPVFDYMYKEASGGCSSTGWTCSQRLTFASLPGNYLLGNLTAGTEYLIMLDAELLHPATQIFMITCPTNDPCATITTLSCATPVTATLTGTGVWNSNACNMSTPGREKAYRFTPSVSGSHSIQVSAASGGSINYMYKEAYDECTLEGWICVDEAGAPGNYPIGNLTAGTEYYIMLDAEQTSTTTQTFQVNCSNPCTSVTALTCGTPATFSKSGFGVWNQSDCLNGSTAKGKEQVYSFTPTVSGPHALQVTSVTGSQSVTYAFQEGGCSFTSWTCIGSTNHAQTFPIGMGILLEGVTYYILVDAVSELTTTQTFKINCLELCDIRPVITCETTVNADMGQAVGLWELGGCSGGSALGAERFYSFTPTATGLYKLEVTYVHNWVNRATYYYKAASSQCTPTGWTCITSTNEFPKTFNIGTLTAGQEYHFLVDGQTPGYYPTRHDFIIHCPPDCASGPLTPDDGASFCPPNPTELSWEAVAGVEGYDVYFGTTTTPPLYTATSGTSISLGSLPAATYYWRIRPYNGTGAAGGCEIWSFTVKNDVGDLFSNPIVIGSLPYIGGGDNIPANCWSNDYTGANNQSSSDVFYRFTNTACQSEIHISLCLSDINDSYLHLLDADGTQIAVNNNNGPLCAGSQASIKRSLAPGTYYIVVEGAGSNNGNYLLQVSAHDNVPPVLTCPVNPTAPVNASCQGILPDYRGGVASDNCPEPVVVTQSPVPGSSFTGSKLVTLTATDAAAQISTCSFTVTAADNTPPTIACPGTQTVVANSTCQAALSNYATAAMASDNCTASPTKTQTPAGGAMLGLGTTLVTLRATDAAGLTGSCTFNVAVTDQTAPAITCPANITMNNAAGVCGATVNYSMTSTDNCAGAASTLTLLGGPASGAVFPVATTTVSYRATDPSGNSASCSFTVRVNDTQLPAITCPANQTLSNTPGVCFATVIYTTPTPSDNCAVSSNVVVSGQPSGTGFPVGTTTVTYRATDPSGNSATCSFTVTVNDTQLPAITCPSNQTMSNNTNVCGATTTYSTPTTSDNCTVSSNVLVSGQASGTVFPIGATTVIYRATDPSSNSATCSFTVTVNDIQLPAITCPGNQVLSNDPNVCGATVTYDTPTASDNCSVSAIQRIAGKASGMIFFIGETLVAYRATDAAGNTSSCLFTVTVNDTQPPAITCPANLTFSNEPLYCFQGVTYTTPTASDNCFVTFNVLTNGPFSGWGFQVGTTMVSYQASDASGNTATCSFTVTVNDTELPVITCPVNQTLSTNPGICGATATYSTPTALDNCFFLSNVLVSGEASGTIFPIGTTTVIYRATDQSGNSSTCSFSVTVNDTQLPVITCPANQTLSNNSNVCGATVNYSTPTASDNCTISSNMLVSGQASGTVFPIGTTTVSYRATDPTGNSATCSFTVTVNDTQIPVITCPANQTLSNNPGVCGATVTYGTPTALDNCSIPSNVLVSGQASGAVFLTGTTTVSYRATDLSGNSATCSFTVTVNDTQLPVNTCPSGQTLTNNPNVCGATVSYSTPTATDNCSVSANLRISGPASGTVFPIGTTVVVYLATDPSGNSVNLLVYGDRRRYATAGHHLSGQPNLEQQPNVCGATVNYSTPTASDNCSALEHTRFGASQRNGISNRNDHSGLPGYRSLGQFRLPVHLR